MGLWPFLFAALVFRACAAPSVSYDERSLILDGARVFTLSGSVHYQRVLPADWPRVLQLAVEMGLNSIQTCVSSASTAQGENRETYAPHPPPPHYTQTGTCSGTSTRRWRASSPSPDNTTSPRLWRWRARLAYVCTCASAPT